MRTAATAAMRRRPRQGARRPPATEKNEKKERVATALRPPPARAPLPAFLPGRGSTSVVQVVPLYCLGCPPNCTAADAPFDRARFAR